MKENLKLELMEYEKELKTMSPESLVKGDVAFEIAWHFYPLKIGKKKAKRHFIAHVKTKADWSRIVAAHNKYVEYVQDIRRKRFSMRFQNGATWFNNWKAWAEMAEGEQ